MKYDESKDHVEVLTPVGAKREFPIRMPKWFRPSRKQSFATAVTLLIIAAAWIGYRAQRATETSVKAVEQKQQLDVSGTQQDREKLKAELKSELLAELRGNQPVGTPAVPPVLTITAEQIPAKPVKTNPPARVVVNDLTEGKPTTPRRRQISSAVSSRVVTESVLDARLATLAREAGLLTNRKR